MRYNMRTLAIIFLGIMLSASSCRDKYPGEPLALHNNSDKRIYYWYPSWKSGKNWLDYCYPDTVIPQKRYDLNAIAPHNGVVGNVSAPTSLESPQWTVHVLTTNSGQREFGVYRLFANFAQVDSSSLTF